MHCTIALTNIKVDEFMSKLRVTAKFYMLFEVKLIRNYGSGYNDVTSLWVHQLFVIYFAFSTQLVRSQLSCFVNYSYR